MDPFAIEFFAIITATGVAATVFEHARKFSEDPKACRLRGWFFVAGGLFGATILPAMLIDQGTRDPLNGFVVGSFFPLFAGAVFIWRSARYRPDGKTLWQNLQDLRTTPGLSEKELELMEQMNREKRLVEKAKKNGHDDDARQTWPS